MSYPDLPNNRLIVNDIDLTERYGLILVDGYTLEPPEPKTYSVDIPGGNGQIDLTSALTGDVVYNNRSQEFTFYAIDVKNFEELKTEISKLLHGKAFDYKITMDPDYTYHGRFTVTSYDHGMYTIGKVGVIKVKIDADPYKSKGKRTLQVNTAGGTIIMLQNGRKHVRPTIETDGSVKIIGNGVEIELPSGSWQPNDIIFKEGANELYLRAMESEPSTTWNYLADKTWSELSQCRWYEWMYSADSDEEINPQTWGSIASKNWSEVSTYRWSDLITSHKRQTEEAIVYIQYDWSDL